MFQSSGAVVDGTESQPDDIGAFHHDIERQIRDSGLEWTFLRLAVASADALQWAFDVPGQLQRGDLVRGPWADAQVSPIHPADFAAVAIAALTGDEHAGRTYTVTGPRSITHAEQIAALDGGVGGALPGLGCPGPPGRRSSSQPDARLRT